MSSSQHPGEGEGRGEERMGEEEDLVLVGSRTRETGKFLTIFSDWTDPVLAAEAEKRELKAKIAELSQKTDQLKKKVGQRLDRDDRSVRVNPHGGIQKPKQWHGDMPRVAQGAAYKGSQWRFGQGGGGTWGNQGSVSREVEGRPTGGAEGDGRAEATSQSTGASTGTSIFPQSADSGAVEAQKQREDTIKRIFDFYEREVGPYRRLGDVMWEIGRKDGVVPANHGLTDEQLGYVQRIALGYYLHCFQDTRTLLTRDVRDYTRMRDNFANQAVTCDGSPLELSEQFQQAICKAMDKADYHNKLVDLDKTVQAELQEGSSNAVKWPSLGQQEGQDQ